MRARNFKAINTRSYSSEPATYWRIHYQKYNKIVYFKTDSLNQRSQRQPATSNGNGNGNGYERDHSTFQTFIYSNIKILKLSYFFLLLSKLPPFCLKFMNFYVYKFYFLLLFSQLNVRFY